MLKKQVLVTAVFVLISGLMAGPASAEWPRKAIQMMIPWPAGNDPSTMVATAMAPHMSEELGVPVKVVNKPGGGAVLHLAPLADGSHDEHRDDRHPAGGDDRADEEIAKLRDKYEAKATKLRDQIEAAEDRVDGDLVALHDVEQPRRRPGLHKDLGQRKCR